MEASPREPTPTALNAAIDVSVTIANGTSPREISVARIVGPRRASHGFVAGQPRGVRSASKSFDSTS
jgi:hypothetical protein